MALKIARKSQHIQCPNCGRMLDLFDDEFYEDALLDDADDTDVKCLCGSILPVTTHAQYSFTVNFEVLERA